MRLGETLMNMQRLGAYIFMLAGALWFVVAMINVNRRAISIPLGVVFLILGAVNLRQGSKRR